MSRPWNRSVDLRVSPQRVAATLRQGWPRRELVARAQRVAVPATADAARGDIDDDAVESVLRELDAICALKGARLNVGMSGALIHFDVVAGDFAANTDRQLGEVAGACVAELLGDAAADHELRWQLQRDERHLLICALAQPSLSTLDAAARALGLRLASVQPLFLRAWNDHGRKLPAGDSVFAVQGQAELTIASVRHGTIANIVVGRAATPTVRAAEAAPAARRRVALSPESVSGPPATAAARFAFAPAPADSAARGLDTRVEALLAGLGRDAADQNAFVLVCAEGPPPLVSQRWRVIDASEVSA